MRAALVLVASCASAAPAPPAVPRPAQATPLAQVEASPDLDGALVGTSTQPTVMMWMASWCGRCRDELVVFDQVRAQHPGVRWLALNYKAHEEYDNRGDALAIRALASETPWLRVVPAGDELFMAFGGPPKIPVIYVYDSADKLIATFDRRERPAPDATELDTLLRSLR